MPTKAELTAKAKELGLRKYSTLNKADLETLVNNALASIAPKPIRVKKPKTTPPPPAPEPAPEPPKKAKVKRPLAERKYFKAGVAKVKETLAKGKAEALLKKAMAKYKEEKDKAKAEAEAKAQAKPKKVKRPLAERKYFKAGVAKVKETLAKGVVKSALERAVAKYKEAKAKAKAEPVGEYDAEYEEYYKKMRARVDAVQAYKKKEEEMLRRVSKDMNNPYSQYAGMLAGNIIHAGGEEYDIMSKAEFIKEMEEDKKAKAKIAELKKSGKNPRIEGAIKREQDTIARYTKELSEPEEREVEIQKLINTPVKTAKDKKDLLGILKKSYRIGNNVDAKYYDVTIDEARRKLAEFAKNRVIYAQSNIAKARTKIDMMIKYGTLTKSEMRKIQEAHLAEGKKIPRPARGDNKAIDEYNKKIQAINDEGYAMIEIREMLFD